MIKVIFITFLFIGQFAISQNEIKNDSEYKRNGSEVQKENGLFQNRINVQNVESGNIDKPNARQNNISAESTSIYKDSSGIRKNKINRNFSTKHDSSEGRNTKSQRIINLDSNSINKHQGMKISKRRVPAFDENEE